MPVKKPVLKSVEDASRGLEPADKPTDLARTPDRLIDRHEVERQ